MPVDFPDDIVDLDPSIEYIRFLTIGENGSGKTPLAASASNGLLIATEKGTASAARRGSKMKLWPCKSWEDFDKAKNWLEEASWGDGIPFDWVSIDSGTAAQAQLLRHILKVETEENPTSRGKISSVHGAGLDIPEIQDHQLYQNRFKRYMEELTDLPVNICVTAVPMSIEISDGGEGLEEHIVAQFLGGKGSIAWYVTGLFDCGGRVELRKRKKGDKVESYQRQHFKKQGAWWGRDRYECLGAYQDNLTLDKLAEIVNEEEE